MKLNGGQACRYYYDDMGQLIREDNTPLGKTYVYTYDDAGNLLSKKIYTLNSQGGTPTGLISTYNYGYTDANWGDKLTSYRGHTITYDGVGNPLSYYNGKAYSFTWSGGRCLATASVGSYQLSFEYNDEGIRTSKSVGSVKHTYYLNGSQIMAETWGETLLVYLYDAEGNPIGMQYRNIYANANVFDTYWFEKNLQGDIIAVYNSSGVKLISYTYDAWGNVTTSYHNGASSYSVADKNPFRYRGYYYDVETELYYLQSRYYDPAIGRFINADAYASTGQGILGNNMFTYCLNNPVAFIDMAGTICKVCFSDESVVSENPWRKHSLSSGGWRGDKFYTPHSYTPQVSSHGEWFVSGEWDFFRPTDTGFIVVSWNMSVYEIAYIFDGEPYQYLSFGNIDAYIGFDVQKGIGFDAGASLVGWEYDFGDLQLGLDCVSIGFTSIFDEGIYDFGVGFGLFGFDISVDYEEILSQILGG